MTAGLVAAGALLAGPVPLGPGGALAASPPHWGHYRWAGGSEQADIRAFWLFDRTGDARMHDVIPTVTEGGNAARDEHPELPYIAVYQDDANAGKCFVNRTPGYSVARPAPWRPTSRT